MKRLAVLMLGGILSACGANPSNPQTYGPGNNYSSVPCSDNCGGDAQCQMHCTNSTTPAFPSNGQGVSPGPGLSH